MTTLTGTDLIQPLAGLRPLVVDHGKAASAGRSISDELAAAGLLGLLVPRHLGGLESSERKS
jgi:hypothetical protein